MQASKKVYYLMARDPYVRWMASRRDFLKATIGKKAAATATSRGSVTSSGGNDAHRHREVSTTANSVSASKPSMPTGTGTYCSSAPANVFLPVGICDGIKAGTVDHAEVAEALLVLSRRGSLSGVSLSVAGADGGKRSLCPKRNKLSVKSAPHTPKAYPHPKEESTSFSHKSVNAPSFVIRTPQEVRNPHGKAVPAKPTGNGGRGATPHVKSSVAAFGSHKRPSADEHSVRAGNSLISKGPYVSTSVATAFSSGPHSPRHSGSSRDAMYASNTHAARARPPIPKPFKGVTRPNEPFGGAKPTSSQVPTPRASQNRRNEALHTKSQLLRENASREHRNIIAPQRYNSRVPHPARKHLMSPVESHHKRPLRAPPAAPDSSANRMNVPHQSHNNNAFKDKRPSQSSSGHRRVSIRVFSAADEGSASSSMYSEFGGTHTKFQSGRNPSTGKKSSRYTRTKKQPLPPLPPRPPHFVPAKVSTEGRVSEKRVAGDYISTRISSSCPTQASALSQC